MTQMTTIVRGRQKPVEEFPAWAKCCARSMAENHQLGIVEVEVNPIPFLGNRICSYCGRKDMDLKCLYVVRVLSGNWHPEGPCAIVIECFDFDEGLG